MAEKLQAHAVILAGGRGTRFWPRSRTRTPKQLLNIIGKETMLQQTVKRLAPVFPMARTWVVTNSEQAAAVRKNLPALGASRVLAEPLGRNTAAAIALAAIHIQKASRGSDALMAVLPADHYIAEAEKYRGIVKAALEVAVRGPNLVVLGIPPAHPETGYGYIERAADDVGARLASPRATQGSPLRSEVYSVERFTEKPSIEKAREYVEAGNYFWNAGMFFWRVSTFLDHLKKFLPATHKALVRLQRDIGTSRYAGSLKRIYPKLENISVDYAIMERATVQSDARNVFVLPADVGWSDIGSWAAVYDLAAIVKDSNVSAGPHFALDASGNYLFSPKKFVAAIGVRDLIVVETDDALLICPRERAQDVGKIVKWLEEKKQKSLL